MMPRQLRYFATGAALAAAIGLILATGAILASAPDRQQQAVVPTGAGPIIAQSEFYKDPDGPWPGGRIWLGTKPAAAAAEPGTPKISIAIDRRQGLDI